MNFYDKVNGLCRRKGMSITALAVELGFSKGSATGWKKMTKPPRAANVKKIADYFGVSVDYLLDDLELSQPNTNSSTPTFTAKAPATTTPSDELSDEERRVIEAYRSLPIGKQAFLLETIEKLADTDKSSKKTNRA